LLPLPAALSVGGGKSKMLALLLYLWKFFGDFFFFLNFLAETEYPKQKYLVGNFRLSNTKCKVFSGF